MNLSDALRTYLVLGRVSNLPTVWSNVAVGWFLSGGIWSGQLFWILLGMSLVYIAGMTLNDAFDAEWDGENAPVRPIPSGQVRRGAVWAVGLGQMALGLGCLLSLTSVPPLLAGLLVLLVFLYNWLHKRWSGSVLIMGACRALVYLGAASAVAASAETSKVSGLVLVVSGCVIAYIAGLTLVARSEHLASPGGLRFFPRLLLMLPVLFPLLGARSVPDSLLVHSLVAVGLIGVWSWLVIVRRALVERLPKGIGYAIAGIAFFDAAIVVFADWRAAVACLVCFVLALGAQRVIPAT